MSRTTSSHNSGMSASLIGRSGSSTFRLSTAQVVMSLAGSRQVGRLAPDSVAVTQGSPLGRFGGLRGFEHSVANHSHWGPAK
jgi:hypothetical protein